MKLYKTMLPLVFVVLAGSVQAGSSSTKIYSADVVGARSGFIPPTDSVEVFEAKLKESYIGTYAIYGSLPEQHKIALYASIKEGGDIKDFRNRVINIRLKRY
jgi:hypothetical protein